MLYFRNLSPPVNPFVHSVVPRQQVKKLNLCTCDILSTNEFRLFSVCVLHSHYP